MICQRAAFQDNSQNTDQQRAKQSRSPNCLKRTFDPDESAVSRPRKRRAEAPIELNTNSKTTGSTGLNLVEQTNVLPPSEFRSRFLSSSSSLLSFTSNKTAPNTTPAFTLDIELEAFCDLSESDFNACFKLIEETSSQAYRDSRKGWRPKAKRKEMQDPDMRYLLVREHPSPQPLAESNDSPYLSPGFLSFMITLDDDYEYPVLYIYEIHLSSELRSCGLGAHLIQIAEHIGRGVGVTKTMLTVFTSNTAAERFYRRLGYSQDEISPEPRILRNGLVKPVDYMIMSKLLEDQGQLQ